MPRSPESQWQLAFDFGQKRAAPEMVYAVSAAPLAGCDSREPALGRFVHTLQEELVVRTPATAATYLLEHVFTPFDTFEQEELVALMLNTQNRVTHSALIYRGTIDSVHVRMAEIFRPAVRVNARSLILAHNHPSGAADPSPEDVRLTTLCAEAARLLDITCLDHIVVGRDVWVSLKERGLGFDR